MHSQCHQATSVNGASILKGAVILIYGSAFALLINV